MTVRSNASPSTRVAAVSVVLLAVSACAGADDRAGPPDPAPGEPSAAPAARGTIIVFAAASLTDAFTEIGELFETANPGVTVIFNYGGSSTLAQQIVTGAPADVFAAASPATMMIVTDAGDAVGSEVIAGNRLEIAVPADDPGGITGLPDFARQELTIAVCEPTVPCGAASERVFEAAGITAAPDTLEQDVRAALTKVELGEVDAALVYRTDVLAAGSAVEGIAFPEADEAVNDYPVATLSAAPNAEGAQAFVSFVLGSEGQDVLADAGFDSP